LGVDFEFSHTPHTLMFQKVPGKEAPTLRKVKDISVSQWLGNSVFKK